MKSSVREWRNLFSFIVFFFYREICAQECGWANRIERLLIEDDTMEGSWPWMVAIGKQGAENYFDHWCSGSLITNKNVLSTAHCFGNSDPSLYKAKIGHVDERLATKYAISRIDIHDSYVDGLYYDDIAILTLENEVDSEDFNPVCLPPHHEFTNLIGQFVTLVGWGRITSSRTRNPLLREKFGLMIISDTKCNEKLNQNGYDINKTLPLGVTGGIICTDYSTECIGDSGSPLMYQEEDQWYVMGLMSFGGPCDKLGFPTGYTRVSKYLGWIGSNLKLETPEIEFTNETTVDNSNTVTLHWRIKNEGSLPVKGFRLYAFNHKNETNNEVHPVILENTTNYTIHDLWPGAIYTFKIVAFNKFGKSDFAYWNVLLPPDVPLQVPWTRVIKSTNQSLLFQWKTPYHDGGTSITRYLLLFDHPGESNTIRRDVGLEIPGLTNDTHLYRGLEPGEAYLFQVRACNFFGCGKWSEPLEGITLGDLPPKVSEVSVLAYTNKTILLMWKKPNNYNGTRIIQYVLLLHHRLGSIVFLKDVDVDHTNQTHMFEDLEPKETYTFQVQACNDLGCGGLSDPLKIKTSNSPPQVTRIKVSGATNYLLVIEFINPSHKEGGQVTFYIPQLRDQQGTLVSYETELVSKQSKFNSYIYGDLNPGETYEFKIQACNEDGCSRWSKPLDAKTENELYI